MARKGVRAQVSVEYMALVAMSLFIALVLWLTVSSYGTQTTDQSAISNARQAVSRIRDAANLVYTQGPPTTVTVYIITTKEVQYVNATGRTVMIGLRTSDGNSDIFEDTFGNLTSYRLDTIASTPGEHTLIVASIQNATGMYVQVNATG